MVAFYFRDGILKAALNVKYALEKLIPSNDGRYLCYQLTWHCHVAVTMSAQLLQPKPWNSVILEKKFQFRVFA